LVALEAVELQKGKSLGVDEGRLVEDVAVPQDVGECVDPGDFVQPFLICFCGQRIRRC